MRKACEDCTGYFLLNLTLKIFWEIQYVIRGVRVIYLSFFVNLVFMPCIFFTYVPMNNSRLSCHDEC